MKRLLKKTKKTCPNSKLIFFVLFLWQNETCILPILNVILLLASIDVSQIFGGRLATKIGREIGTIVKKSMCPKLLPSFAYLSFDLRFLGLGDFLWYTNNARTFQCYWATTCPFLQFCESFYYFLRILQTLKLLKQ